MYCTTTATSAPGATSAANQQTGASSYPVIILDIFMTITEITIGFHFISTFKQKMKEFGEMVAY